MHSFAFSIARDGRIAIPVVERSSGDYRYDLKAVETLKRLRRRAETEEELVRRHWELASIAANLHTFEPDQIASLAEKAGFEDIKVGTAWWSWILVLGINYYLVGEFERLAANRVARAAARAAVNAAATFDRIVADRVVPPRWRHTIQAVLR